MMDKIILEEIRRALDGEDAELAVRLYMAYRERGRKGVMEVVEELLRGI